MMNLTFQSRRRSIFQFFFWLHDLWDLSSQIQRNWQWNARSHNRWTVGEFLGGHFIEGRTNRSWTRKSEHMCLPVILESIGHGESKQSLLFTVYFPSFFQTILISAFLGKFTARVWGRTVERQSCILCCLLPQGTLLWPGLQRAFWRRLPPPQRYRGVRHVAGNSPPHHSTYWALPNLFLLVSRENLPGSCTQPLSNPSFLSPMNFAASQLGVHRHIPGVYQGSTKSLNVLFSLLDRPDGHTRTTCCFTILTCFSIWLKVMFIADNHVLHC